jgi:glycosyltransferase involved in cell wall biosynthesis
MGMEFRPYYLASEWKRAGYNVCIVSADYSHLRQQNPEIRSTGDIQDIDGIKFYWIKTNIYRSNGKARFISILKFCLSLMLLAKRIGRKFMPDFVIASSTYPFDIFPAKRIADFTHAKLIHELHDMWPLSLIELGGMGEKHIFVKLVKKAEKYIYNNIDAEISILANTKDYMVKHGLVPSKFFHIPNGIEIETISTCKELSPSNRVFLENIKKKGKFICCYFGSHTKSYGLDLLLESKRGCRNIALLLVGDGYYKNDLIKSVEDSKIEDVYFMDPIPKAEIQSLLQMVDCIYVGTNGSVVFRYGISMNKLYDSMYSGKPVILAADSPNNIIQITQCGKVVFPITTQNLKNALQEMSNLDRAKLEEMGKRGRDFVVNNCNYSIISSNFLKILEQL